jgi:hypothetical protein
MTIYYHDQQVLITSDGIQVEQRFYPLAELRAAWPVRERRPLEYGARLMRLLAIVGAVAAVVLGCAGLGLWAVSSRSGPTRVGAALAVVLVIGIVAAVGVRLLVEGPLEMLDRLHLHGAARHELRANVRGREVVVFATDDAHRFGKVYRSLRRAIEGRSG